MVRSEYLMSGRFQEVIGILQDLSVDFKGELCDVIYVFKNIIFAAIQRVNFRQWYASKYLQLAIRKIYFNNSWFIAHSNFCGINIATMANIKLPMFLKVELKSDAHNWLLKDWTRQFQKIPDWIWSRKASHKASVAIQEREMECW